MKITPVGVTLALLAAHLLNTGHGLWQRSRLFATQGELQTLTVIEQVDRTRISSFAPPRWAHTYTGRLGQADARIETAHALQPGDQVRVRFIRAGSAVPLDRLGGRTDRLVPPRPGTEPVWFARASEGDSITGNALADLPAAERVFYAGWLMLLILTVRGRITWKRRVVAGYDPTHPALRPNVGAEPLAQPASARILLPDRPTPAPPPLPEPAADDVSSATLSLPRRSPPSPPPASADRGDNQA